MTDKVEKIRQEVEKLVYSFNLEADIASCEDAEAEKLANIKYQLCKKILEFIDSIQDEPISERFAFKAIPRLLEMIEPTDRAKAYTAKLADALEVEGYLTDAKIARERLKIMNGEKVSMVTMDGESISENLEEAMQHNAPDNIGIDDLIYWRNGFITGAKLASERSSAYIDMLAKWRKAQFEKN